jgi:hypothetical protein
MQTTETAVRPAEQPIVAPQCAAVYTSLSLVAVTRSTLVLRFSPDHGFST